MSALVQQKVGNGGSAPFTIAFNNPVVAGNFIRVDIAVANGFISVSSDIDGPLSLAVSNTGAGIASYIYYKENASAGIHTLTLTPNVRAGVTAASIQEWSGIRTSGSADANNGTNFGGAVVANPVTPTIVPSAPAMIATVLANLNNIYSSGPTNGYTRMTQSINGGGAVSDSAYKTGVNAATQTDWTLSVASFSSCVIVAFLEATASTTPKKSAITRGIGLGLPKVH